MLPKRAFCVGLLALSGLALAQPGNRPTAEKEASRGPATSDPVRSAIAAPAVGALPAEATDVLRQAIARRNRGEALRQMQDRRRPQGQVIARRTLPKRPSAQLAVPAGASGRLIIKFKDDWKVRLAPDGTLVSAAGRDLQRIIQIAKEANLTFERAIKMDRQKLARIEARAAASSGVAQPFLSGLVYLDGPGGVPVPVAAALNELNLAGAEGDPVEFLHYESKYVIKGPPGTDVATRRRQGAVLGACCTDEQSACFEVTLEECNARGGLFWGVGSSCGEPMICGACCIDLACAVDTITQPICEDDLGGIFLAMAVCDGEADPCLLSAGACCLPSGSCFEVLSEQCDDLGGTWLGPTTVCGGPKCGACCVPGADPPCAVSSKAECAGTFFDSVSSCDDAPCTPACGAKITGPCLDLNNPTPFCNDSCFGFDCPTCPGSTSCCEAVCAIDPTCCAMLDPDQPWAGRGVTWDDWCVDHALEICFRPFGASSPPSAPDHNRTANTPNFTSAQGYLTPTGYTTPSGSFPPDIAPALRWNIDSSNILDGYSGEGFDLQSLWALGEFFVQNGQANENLTRGRTIKVGIVEFSAFVSTAKGPDAPYMHEDLHGKVIPEAGQTPLIIPGSSVLAGNHGTATLGIVGAIDNDSMGNPRAPGGDPASSLLDQRGCVGIAPEAELHFFPIVSLEQPGGRLLDAIANALDIFGSGDVLSFSIGPAGCGTLASEPNTWLMLRLAADLGVTCCISAGNDGCQLGTQAFGLDSGAIVVGAVYPGCDQRDCPAPSCAVTNGFNCYCRLHFSNYGTAHPVHVSAWGDAVATLGYGGMFEGTSNNSNNRSYTASFGGTSAAAPQIAALVANLQGLAKMFYRDSPDEDGITLMPEQIRSIVSTGFFQCGLGPAIAPPGSSSDCILPPGLHAGGDWNFAAAPNVVEPYPEPFAAAVELLARQFFDGNPLIDEIIILRGNRIYGNRVSILASDDNYLVVDSQFTKAGLGSHPQLPASVGYPVFGQYADIVVIAHADAPGVNAMVVSVEARVTGSGTPGGILFVELFDWQQNFWSFGGIGLVGASVGGLDPFFQFQVGSAARFVRPSDDRVFIRVWTLGMAGIGGGIGGGGANRAKIRMFYDLIRLQVGADFADIDP